MENLGELLRKLRGKRSLRDAAELTGLSHTYISDIEKGVRHDTKAPIKPSPDALKRLAKAYNYSYPNLMVAAGYIDKRDRLSFILDKDEAHELHEKIVRYGSGDSNDGPEKYGLIKIDKKDLMMIPILGTIRAGQPIDRIENIEGYLPIGSEFVRGRKLFVLTVRGESMAGDEIHDGDMVIVAYQEDIEPNDIAVIAINGDEATLKRLQIKGETCVLSPSNPSYQPIITSAKDIKVIGKVIRHIRDYE
jgi:repressor LexA